MLSTTTPEAGLRVNSPLNYSGILKWTRTATSRLLLEVGVGGSILAEANLQDATLVSARMAGANLRGANLTKADLSGADLRGADLTGAEDGDVHEGLSARGAAAARARTAHRTRLSPPRRERGRGQAGSA